MPTKRPALSTILGAGTPIEQPKEIPAPEPSTETAPTPITELHSASPSENRPTRKPKHRTAQKEEKVMSRRAAGHVQLNVLLPHDLRKRAKVAALQEDRDLSEVIETLLRQWIAKHTSSHIDT